VFSVLIFLQVKILLKYERTSQVMLVALGAIHTTCGCARIKRVMWSLPTKAAPACGRTALHRKVVASAGTDAAYNRFTVKQVCRS